MRRLIVLIMVISQLTITSKLFSQEPESVNYSYNSLYLEASTLINSFSMKYNILLNTTSKSKPYLGLGVQYFPYSISNEDVFTLFPHIGYMYGNKNLFETSIGVSLDFKYKEHLFPIYFGYRYQSQSNLLLIKAGFNFIYLGSEKDDSFLDLPSFLPLPTIGIGINW